MLKAAIEKIQDMACDGVFLTKDGVTYGRGSDGDFHEIYPEPIFPHTQHVNSLDAVVKMVQTEAMNTYKGPIYIEAVQHDRVIVFIQPDYEIRAIRPILYDAHATDVPGWEQQTRLPFDQAAVALQTRFQPGGDREYALQLLSQITTGAKVTYNDTGVATTVVTQKGVSLQQNTTIKPILTLRPYRTFQELEQPDGLFLIRIDDRGITFTEADRGMWKLEARKRVAAYFEEHLKNEIESGAVVVML